MVDLLNEIHQNNITLSLDGENLKLGFKDEVMDEVLITKIRDNKQEIISYLSKYTLLNKENRITKVEAGESYEVSSSQLRMLSSILIDTGVKGYNYSIPNLVRFQQKINVSHFKQAVYNTIDRHESLRTVFKINEEGQIRQYVLQKEDINFKIDFQDFRTQEDKEKQIKNITKNDKEKPFDIEHGPLLRICLFQLADSEFILYCNIHHVISDSWSLDVLFKDIFEFYSALESGVEHKLPALNIQYKDYAAWQNKQLEKGLFKKQEDYFKATFSGEIPVLNFTNNKTRPAERTINGFALKSYLSKETTTAFRALCTHNGGSVFMGLLAVWNVLFYKYTNSKDIIIGTAVAGRDHADLKEQVGCYINSLPLRNTIDPGQTFNAFFNSVKENTLDALNGQFYPFERLVKLINYNRERSRSPLFDVMLLLQNAVDHSNITLEENQIGAIRELGKTSALTDLDINFLEEGDYLSCHLAYNTDVFEAEYVTNLLIHFRQLVETIVLNPNTAIEELDYLSVKEKEQLLFDFNDIVLEYDPKETLLSGFDKQVQRSPDTIALVAGGKKFTYEALDKISTDFAHYIRKHYQVTKGNLIGIQLDRDEWSIISMLGILKSGCAYVPIAPDMPVHIKEHIISDTQLNLLITTTSYSSDLDFYTGAIMKVDTGFDASDCETTTIEVGTSDLAYIIFTSGSTGLPKGVMIEQGQIVNTILSQIDYFKLDQNSRGLQFAPFSFDASVWEIFMILLSGGSLYIIGEKQRKDVSVLTQYIKENKITIVTLPPSYLALMNIEDLQQVEHLITAGEAPDYEIIKPFLAYGNYYNAYGPTEASICGTIFKMPKNSQPDYDSIPIGKPIANAKIHILDEHHQLVPVGVAGEICIGGTGVGRGYLNREELTKNKFIKSQFHHNERLYKTGDLGKWTKEGSIIYIGRNDEQVKIRGYRVELSAIEHQLLSHEKIDEAVVIVQNDGRENKELVAYIVMTAPVSIEELRAFLSKILPDYMIPTSFIFLDKIPLTLNGKVDRKALVKTVGVELYSEVEYVAPTTAEEKILVEVCEKVLDKKNIGIKDDFFSLGGESIKAVMLIASLKQKGFVLKVDHILRNPILEDLTKLMTLNTRNIDQSEVTGEILLTPIQHYFFANSAIKEKQHYNQSVLLKAKETISSVSLIKALTQIVNHHDALRIHFEKENEVWKQRNLNSTVFNFDIELYDLRDEDDALSAMKIIGEEIQSGFNLQNERLIRAVVFKLKDGDRLALFVHHLIIDGVSWRILLQDLSEAYAHHQRGEQYELPLKTDSYQYWAKGLHQYASGLTLEKERLFWEEHCSLDIPQLPADFEPAEVYYHDRKETFLLDKEYTNKLQTQISKQYTIEINETLISGLGLALAEVFQVKRTVLKMEGHGREDILPATDISRTIGWFTSVFPFVLEIASSDTIENILKIKKDLSRIPQKGIGYGILNFLNKESNLERETCIEFNYLGDFGSKVGTNETSSFDFSTESIGAPFSEKNGSDAKLSINGIISSGQLMITVAYSSETFKTATIQRLVKTYQAKLEQTIDDLVRTEKEQNKPITIDDQKDITEQIQIQEDWVAISENQRRILQFPQSHGRFGPIVISDFSKDSFENKFREFLGLFPFLNVKFKKESDGAISQKYISNQEVNLEIKIVDDYKETEREKAEIALEAFFTSPYDLYDNSSLIRLFLIADTTDKTYLFVSIHHAVTDMYTNSIVHQNLQNFFAGKPIENKYKSNYEFIAWQQQFLKSETACEQRDYWKEYLKGFDMVNQNQVHNNFIDCVTQKIIVKGENFQKLIQKADKMNLPITAICIAAHQKLLHQVKNNDKHLQLTIVNGREEFTKEIEINKILGVLNNFLPVGVLDSSAYSSHKDFILAVYADYLQSRLYQTIPYEIIRNDYKEMTAVDIEGAIGGTFNYRVVDHKTIEDSVSGEVITTSYNKNNFNTGLDLKCLLYENGILLDLTYPVSYKAASEKSFELDFFLKDCLYPLLE
ncbi:non-ribosomal peptide synthetase [Flavobacterium lipolyticum]|uniref:Amino acid adenylation domain-containing protein n=1 Tax=Flavobacterium lipolyticum TaxID=2893754 RepID=A0ABS8M238_9FLAO|nr:non-ribosomal peptide synthetase [Flavobacterium sp. F-126]MCC9018875.1 amino acid adenylation domain-containing protein [Flavobacterium sp. F-126]